MLEWEAGRAGQGQQLATALRTGERPRDMVDVVIEHRAS